MNYKLQITNYKFRRSIYLLMRPWNLEFGFGAFRCLFVFIGIWNLGFGASAQVSAELKADSNHILIGDYLNVQLTVKHPKGIDVRMPMPYGVLGEMELVEDPVVDSVEKDGSLTTTKKYIVSAYDSGTYLAGPVKLFFNTASGAADSFISNSITVTVTTLPVDTTKPVKPIKAPMEVAWSWMEFIYYIIAALLLLILGGIAFFMWRKKHQPKPVVVERPKPKDPAHVWAKRELRKLEEEKLWQKDETKQYYSRLTDILRMYLEYRYEWYALESTTEEIAAEIDKYDINDVAKKLLLDTLRTADLVKFAKMQTPADVSAKALENVKDFVEVTASTETKPAEEK